VPDLPPAPAAETGRGGGIGSSGASAPAPPPAPAIEAVLRRDRWIVAGGLVVLTLLAWTYLFGLAGAMEGMTTGARAGEVPGGDATSGGAPGAASDSASMEGLSTGGMPMEGPSMEGMSMAATMAPRIRPWSARDLAFTFAMWAVMMVAMMVPSASPLILLHLGTQRRQGSTGHATPATGAFVLGYLLVWTGFSAVATFLQWGLERLALLSPMMVGTSDVFGGTVLAAAGIYQLTPIKEACLRHCRSPVGFIMHHWRPGTRGALVMGLHHGLYCIGCCWLLMALLFVGGVMNLVWIAALSVLVLLEKLLPGGELLARATGGALLAAGGWLLVGAW
jgi:predicted metal-binding membrane protein